MRSLIGVRSPKYGSPTVASAVGGTRAATHESEPHVRVAVRLLNSTPPILRGLFNSPHVARFIQS